MLAKRSVTSLPRYRSDPYVPILTFRSLRSDPYVQSTSLNALIPSRANLRTPLALASQGEPLTLSKEKDRGEREEKARDKEGKETGLG
jgi:hypothetical protein